MTNGARMIRTLPRNVCVACDQELDPGVKCIAETYAPIVDRAGGHRGDCWDGRFPTTKDMAAERKRQRDRALIPVLPSIANARERQLGLDEITGWEDTI